MNPVLVAPSILAADPLRFAEEIADAEEAGADWHHVDVMDGHFVPNLTFGPPLIRALKKVAKIPLDVHIMVSNPDAVALEYVKAGADVLTFHLEASHHPHRVLQMIREAGCRAGVALNPGTRVETVFSLLSEISVINMMTVNPGFGGQTFIPEVVGDIRTLRAEIERRRFSNPPRIEVDGGVNENTGAQVRAAGAEILVAGTYVYGATDRSDAIRKLREVKA